jgi:hypothetical protein
MEERKAAGRKKGPLGARSAEEYVRRRDGMYLNEE